MAKKIYKISQYFLSLIRKMLKSCSCIISLGRAFRCLIILTKNECKKQFTLANGCLNLNEWFDLLVCFTITVKFKIIITGKAIKTMNSLVAL